MARLDFNHVVRFALGALSLGLIAVLAIAGWQRSKTEYVTLAAGASSGESYILGRALKTVVERHFPRIRITVLETGGTTQNLGMLQDGRAQLATAQADIPAGPRARSVAVLYDDTFQLLVPRDSQAQSLVDLKEKRIALAQSGGQFVSFLHVADHFGLHPAQFQFVGTSDEDARNAFVDGQADAIFRVRSLGDPTIEQLVRSGKVRFLPIGHAPAMKIKYPAFEASLIPVGAYLGNPPVPAQDFPTVAVHRLLLARDDANAPAIRAITEVLIERRQELMQQVPVSMTDVRLLLVQSRRPEPQSELGPAVHPGALSFYDKDKPSFLQAHADYCRIDFDCGAHGGILDMAIEAMDAEATEKSG